MMYFESVSLGLKRNYDTATYWNEQVGNFLLILSPGLSVLSATSRDVSLRAVDDHDHEEDEIKPRERAPVQLLALDPHRDRSTTYLNPVIKPQDIEKNMSGT